MSVSYCITLYNKERYIAGVLEAAAAEREQTGGEILIYDDASTDRSAEIAQAFAARTGARLLRGERNRGVFAATNVLLAEASEPHIRLIDADDQITLGSTRHLMDVQHRYGAILVHGESGTLGKTKPSLGPVELAASSPRPEPRAFRETLRALRYNLSVTIMPITAAKSVLPLPPELRISQDLCIALRLARRGLFVASNLTVSLSPDETTNRLSRRLAALYRDTCLILAMELARGASGADAAFAVRRNAARCRKYFRREAPDGLALHHKLSLLRYSMASALEPIERQCTRLRHIAKLFALDEARVLA